MRIALLAPPFIRVPPRAYGGTELFVAHLAQGLCDRGHAVVVYTNGESDLPCEVRWLFEREDWPPKAEGDSSLKNLQHFAWAIRDVLDDDFDVVHVNDAFAVPLLRFLRQPAVHTLHHPHEPALSALYEAHPEVTYAAISDAQWRAERMPRMHTVHHGLKLAGYPYVEQKGGYLVFLGRMAPVKAPHLAIEVARRAGIPLKLAGEVQPLFADYWEACVKPFIDGKLVEFAGEATLDVKTDLLSNASALLFPIQWEEPFGLVMIEAMACGTPVLAFPGGAVAEVVVNGVTGWVCRDVEEMAARAADLQIHPRACRHHVERRFSMERMVRDYERIYRSCVVAAGAPAVRDPASTSRV